MGDPRAPVIPLAVELDTENVVINSAGEVRQDYRVILKEEDVGRMKAGYVCARCLETQERPFPKQCWICKFPMSDRQSEFIAKAYQGSVRVGPSTSLADELAALDEWEEQQEALQRDEIHRPTQVLLPGKDF